MGFLQREIFLKHGSLWSPNFLLLWREITTWGRAWMVFFVVSSSFCINVRKTTVSDVWTFSRCGSRAKLEAAAMTKHFALERKSFNGVHYDAGSVSNFPHHILQAKRDQKADEVRIDGFSRCLTPLQIKNHSKY